MRLAQFLVAATAATMFVLAATADKRREQERARDAEQRYRAIFEQAGVGVAVLSADGEYLAANERYLEIAGYGREELLGSHYTAILDDADVSASRNVLAQLARDDAPIISRDLHIRTRDGDQRWIRATSSRIVGAAGEVDQVATVVEDISERVKAEVPWIQMWHMGAPVPRLVHIQGEREIPSGVAGSSGGCTYTPLYRHPTDLSPTVEAWTPAVRAIAQLVSKKLGRAYNQALVQRYWPTDNPLDRRVSLDNAQNWISVVGVVGDVHDQTLATEPVPAIYLPMAQSFWANQLFVRTQMDPATIIRPIKEAVYTIDDEQPVDGFTTLEETRSASLASPRLTTSLLGLFAGLALLITMTGISGMIAYSVNQRTQEVVWQKPAAFATCDSPKLSRYCCRSCWRRSTASWSASSTA